MDTEEEEKTNRSQSRRKSFITSHRTWTPEDIDQLQRVFRSQSIKFIISERSFEQTMLVHGIPKQLCDFYLHHFNVGPGGELDYRSVLVAMITIDSESRKGGDWVDTRLEKIFQLFDPEETGYIDVTDLENIANHMLKATGHEGLELANKIADAVAQTENKTRLSLSDFRVIVRTFDIQSRSVSPGSDDSPPNKDAHCPALTRRKSVAQAFHEEIEDLRDRANWTDEEIHTIREQFLTFAGENPKLDIEGFRKIMQSKNVDDVMADRYFKAFDYDGSGSLDFREFLVGMIAMDPDTKHGGFWLDTRLRLIFKIYDHDDDNLLNFDEFLLMMENIMRATGLDVSEPELIREEALLHLRPDGYITREQFVAAVKSKSFRKTSKLLRLSDSVFKRRGRVMLYQNAIRAEPQTGSLEIIMHGENSVKKLQSTGLPNKVARRKSVNQMSGTTAIHHANRVLNTLLSKDYVMPEVVDKIAEPFDLLEPEEITRLLQATCDLLAKEPTLFDIQAPVKVFGDTHGQLEDILRIFHEYGVPHLVGDIDLVNYVFVGDFVDRGCFSLEVACLMMSLKLRYPSKVGIVRGNHEDRDINALYGFKAECESRFEDAFIGYQIWENFNRTFDMLPLGCLIEERILCVHGGIGDTVNNLDQIRNIRRPLRGGQAEGVVRDLLWSDPTDNDSVVGVHASRRGPGMKKYGPDRVRSFCHENGLDLIIRAHQCVLDGYEYFAGGHLITIFSATNYCGTHKNNGAFLSISRDLTILPKVMLRTDKLNDSWGYTGNVSPLRHNNFSTLWHEQGEDSQVAGGVAPQELSDALERSGQRMSSDSSSSSSSDDENDNAGAQKWRGAPLKAGYEDVSDNVDTIQVEWPSSGPTKEDHDNVIMMF